MQYRDQKESQPLVVLKDPMSGGSEQTIAAQMETERGIVADINVMVGLVNSLEIVRGQLGGIADVAGKDTSLATMKKSSEELTNKVIAVERQIYQMQVTGRGQDNVRWPVQLGEQLIYLARSVGGSDYAPTASQKQVAQLLHDRLLKVKALADQLLTRDVAEFNEGLRVKSVHPLVPIGQ
jgi:hypothetical protein